MHKELDSGVVTIDGDQVMWHNDDSVFLKLDLDEVVVIGEYTNSSGPWFDDWFITFVTRKGEWYSIPWYAKNIEELLNLLCDRFTPGLNVSHLTGSTTWKSIVRYPVNLEGLELFEATPSQDYKAPKNAFQKFLFYGLGMGRFNISRNFPLSYSVKRFISTAYA